ncbi:MAG: hypothetical protein JW947_10890 [Sedimentisphaerales bacterium]|nr:hypothetical protein [Sedimentisphaerales bacterium]
MKALYKHKKSGDIFAIEIDEKGKVVSTAGPLLMKDLDPRQLDYDNYFKDEVKAKIKDFILLSKAEYLELLRKEGFVIQSSQKHLF